MADQVMPHDPAAERALLGGILAFPNRIGFALNAINAEDFYVPQHQALYAAMHRLHQRGDRLDAVVVRDELARDGSPMPSDKLMELVAEGTMNVAANVDIVVRHAVSRRVAAALGEVVMEARASRMAPAELVDLAREAIAGIDAPGEVETTGLTTVADFLATAETAPAPWVVPGMLRAGWRCLVVAAEGVGKSVASRQVAIAAAAGVHPFTHEPIPPVRTLIVDLENPDDAIAETCKLVTAQADKAATYDPDRAWLWRRPGGIDLRSRTDRAAFASVLEQTRPQLVCLGPLYKAYRVQARENDELAAGEVQSVLDDLRTRYGFALLMEHHAPKKSGVLADRDLVPYGSSLWLRWPELGIKLRPDDDNKQSLLVGRWRRDRMRCTWPTRLDRGGAGRWPWVGYYAEGWS